MQRRGKPLSDREAAVLQLASEGYRERDICQRLQISQSSVTAYVSRAREKLGAATLTEAVVKFVLKSGAAGPATK